MKVNVCVQPRFRFENGDVKGEIVIDSNSLLYAITSNSVYDQKSPMIVESRKLIAKMNSHYQNTGKPTEIILTDGIVEKQFMQMTMKEVIDILCKYIGLDDKDSLAFDNKYFKQLRDFAYKCDAVEHPSQTANII